MIKCSVAAFPVWNILLCFILGFVSALIWLVPFPKGGVDGVSIGAGRVNTQRNTERNTEWNRPEIVIAAVKLINRFDQTLGTG